jgi:hypothetical protein
MLFQSSCWKKSIAQHDVGLTLPLPHRNRVTFHQKSTKFE